VRWACPARGLIACELRDWRADKREKCLARGYAADLDLHTKSIDS
jgi:hypothetical protein